MGSGVPTGEVVVIGMAVEPRSLGGRRSGGAHLGVGVLSGTCSGLPCLGKRGQWG